MRRCLHRSLTLEGKELLLPQMYILWSHHSLRSFMVTRSAALAVPEDEWDLEETRPLCSSGEDGGPEATVACGPYTTLTPRLSSHDR